MVPVIFEPIMAFSVRTDTQPVIAVSAVPLPLRESTDVDGTNGQGR
jgi:hypothetical protein